MQLRSLRSNLRAIAAAGVAGMALIALPAHAGLFDDDQARQAVLDLRTKTDSLSAQMAAAQRTILDQSNRIDQLQQQLDALRGQNEDLTNQLTTLQRSQKDYYADLDTRLKKLEPQQQTIDGVTGMVQPGEADAFNAALQQFRNGDFKGAAAAFRDFDDRYPQSPYLPTAEYWLGNAYYALRDYKNSTAALSAVVQNYPNHPRAPDALLAIATNQLEQSQKVAARKTLRDIVTQYAGSPAAQTAKDKLVQLK
jgi:tol-pal system protein YbgF